MLLINTSESIEKEIYNKFLQLLKLWHNVRRRFEKIVNWYFIPLTIFVKRIILDIFRDLICRSDLRCRLEHNSENLHNHVTVTSILLWLWHDLKALSKILLKTFIKSLKLQIDQAFLHAKYSTWTLSGHLVYTEVAKY